MKTFREFVTENNVASDGITWDTPTPTCSVGPLRYVDHGTPTYQPPEDIAAKQGDDYAVGEMVYVMHQGTQTPVKIMSRKTANSYIVSHKKACDIVRMADPTMAELFPDVADHLVKREHILGRYVGTDGPGLAVTVNPRVNPKVSQNINQGDNAPINGQNTGPSNDYNLSMI